MRCLVMNLIVVNRKACSYIWTCVRHCNNSRYERVQAARFLSAAPANQVISLDHGLLWRLPLIEVLACRPRSDPTLQFAQHFTNKVLSDLDNQYQGRCRWLGIIVSLLDLRCSNEHVEQYQCNGKNVIIDTIRFITSDPTYEMLKILDAVACWPFVLYNRGKVDHVLFEGHLVLCCRRSSSSGSAQTSLGTGAFEKSILVLW